MLIESLRQLVNPVRRSNIGAEGRRLFWPDPKGLEEKGPSQIPPVSKEFAEDVTEQP